MLLGLILNGCVGMDEPLNDVKPDIDKPNVVELAEPVRKLFFHK
jgi:hypothetical protein